jgi:ABC-2 type transport system ATP-binding protein
MLWSACTFSIDRFYYKSCTKTYNLGQARPYCELQKKKPSLSLSDKITREFEMSIIVREVSRYYGKQKALDNVSFETRAGEIVGFIGPNGAGKSTMMKIICTYLPASSGKVLVNGLNVLENPIEVRRQIGYLPEHNPLYLDMHVREYLQFVAGLYGMGKSAKKAVEEAIEQTGLGVEQHKKIGDLSKGYRQRVGLAQAIVHDPAVLILDEPTTGLDPNQIVEIRSLISELGKEKTVLFSSHIMQEVEAICDRIILIHQGKISLDSGMGDGLQKDIYIHVEFDKPVEFNEIEALSGVEKVVKLKETEGLVKGKAGEDIRPVLFQFAVSKGITVLSMQRQEKGLEELFREHTGNKADRSE